MKTTGLVALALAIGVIAGTITGQRAFANGQAGLPPTDIELSVVVPAGSTEFPASCDFDIRLDIRGKSGTIDLPNNRSIFTSPRLKIVVTNLGDPTKTVRLNATGAFHQTIEPNGDVVTVVTGRNVLLDPVAGVVLATGAFSFVVDAGGNLVQPLTGSGPLRSICEMID